MFNKEKKEVFEELKVEFDDTFDDGSYSELENRIILSDEDGEHEFEFLDLIDYDGKEYIVLLPIEGGEADDEVVILELDRAGENEEAYLSVDDDNTLAAVFEIFREKFKDVFNFVD